MDELRDLTETLVLAPNHEGEAAAGDAIEAWLRRETNADVARDDMGNVVARVNPDIDESLTLVGHHDVVLPADRQTMNSGDYVIETRDGRLYGRGAADMKGVVTASMLALRGVAADIDSEVAFASFVGGEIGGEDVRTVLDDDFELDYAIVAESLTNYPGSNWMDVTVTHRGRQASALVASGTACHASGSERGENAVYRATNVVDMVRDLSAPDAEVLDHPVSGSITVTGIDGGSVWDVIPGRCEATLDERAVPGGFADLARTAELEGIEWVVEQDLPSMTCDDAGFAERVLDTARLAHEAHSGMESEQTTKSHATDAGRLAQVGTTYVVYNSSGPGEAYMKDENVSLDMLARYYETHRTLATNW